MKDLSDRLLLVGRMYRPHGVGGEVKVIPETDDPSRLVSLGTLYLGRDAASARAFGLRGVRSMPTKHGLTLVVKLDGVDTPEDAERLRGLSVYALAEELPPLEAEEHFMHDLVGLQVFTEEGEFIGKVRDVLELPAHPVFVVAREGRDDALIPDVPAFVVSLDIGTRRLTVRVIEGLLD